MNFATVMKNAATEKYTENGAKAYCTTDNALLDMFALGGAMRKRTEQDIIKKFELAFKEDALLATKMLFYIGNIRGGLGERRTFRTCLKWLAQNHSGIVLKNMPYIALFNRWDSVFELIGTPIEPSMWKLITDTLAKDATELTSAIQSNRKPQISLLAKWLPSENASSKKTRKLAREVISKLEISPRLYRKTLSALRRALKVVERDMSANNWDKIYYPGVPSYAMKNYRNAFKSHDEERFNEFIGKAVKGEEKIHSETLYPYDIFEAYTTRDGLWSKPTMKPYDEALEAQWKALPNYVNDGANIVVMADVSGSMYGRPLATSVSLATYFAQRNNSIFKDLYMTFTNNPHFIDISKCTTLHSALETVTNTDMGFSTDLEAAFNAILNLATNNHISQEDMPKALVVISDMEINSYMYDRNLNFVDMMKKRFESAGYKMPKLVMWNVDARHDTFLTKDNGVICVSGSSASTFKTIMRNLSKDAYQTMMDTLNDPMYDCITI